MKQRPVVEIDPKNPFVWTEESYKRDIHPVKHYLDQAAWHLHLQTGKPYDDCVAFVRKTIKDKSLGNIRYPTVRYLERQDNGDREPRELSLVGYIQEIIRNEEIMAPTMTTYIATKKEQSVYADFILENIAKRNKAKHAKFEAEMRGDEVEAFFQGLEDRNTKLSNNAISGAHASSSTPLYNQTNHSTLTSTCRMTSGSGNANNEKLLSGNRHYFKPIIVINNIISITQNIDEAKWQAVITKYNLHVPSVQDVINAIEYSTDLYWQSTIHMTEIRRLVMVLTPVQRAAFLYTGDLHHVRVHNDAFMRKFITELAATTTGQYEDPIKFLKSYPDDYVNLSRVTNVEHFRDIGKDYKELITKEGGMEKMLALAATTEHLFNTCQAYKDFIEVVFVSDNVPAAVPYFPTSIRRSALTSDTDSTIFTVQDWTLWYYGEHVYGDRSLKIANVVVFLAAQAIVHILARMSVNMGVDRKHMWRINMKNEFFFPVYIPTEVSKHYFALQEVKEGNIYSKPKLEKKGVHLKSSNAPLEINMRAEKMMLDILNTVRRGEKISLHDMLTQVADVERSIFDALKRGDSRYCRRGEIKDVESYKMGPIKSNYFHHLFWTEVFSDKYGFKEMPPYSVIKLPGEHKSPRDTAEWLEEIDPQMQIKVKNFLAKYDKDKLGAFMVPENVVKNSGIPPEILAAVNSRKMVSDMSKIFYLLLKTLGYYSLDKKMVMLISDTY